MNNTVLQNNMNVMKTDPDSDNETQPIFSHSKDPFGDIECPVLAMLPAINSENKEQSWNSVAIKEELRDGLITEEHEMCLKSLPTFVLSSAAEEEEENDLAAFISSLSDEDCVEESDEDGEMSVHRVRWTDTHMSNSDISDIQDSDISFSGGDDDDTYHSDDAAPDFTELTSEQDVPVTHIFNYMEIPGPKHVPPPGSEPILYFYLFFNESLWNMLVQETNRYADQFLAAHQYLSQGSRIRQWHEVTVTEMKAFVAVLLEMGITRRPSIMSYWTTNSRCIPWFGKMFSRNRFQLILKFLNVTNNSDLFPPSHKNYNPCAKFQPLVDHANKLFHQYYTPHEHLSIGAAFVGTNTQHHKCRIKMWMLCDSVVPYCLAFYCYPGTKTREVKENIQKHGLGYVVVNDLLNVGGYLMKGFHVVLDSFFTSFQLAHYLYKKCTFLTGSLKRNRRHVPQELRENFDVGHIKYYRSKEILLAGYREKESQRYPMLFLSTNSVIENIKVTWTKNGQERVTMRPHIVQQYNNYVDSTVKSDMAVTYLYEKRAMKHWKKVVFGIFSHMVMNAYIIYKENTPRKKMTQQQFISSIIEAIENEWMLERNWNELATSVQAYTSLPAEGFGIRRLAGRKERVCVVCSRKNGGPVHRSRTICIRCEKGLHGLCMSQHKCRMMSV
ncbi:hypothetical protein B7P43_G09791 [Cryptotermes secundus]|uniref:PiggyBac transposable element-derived protein domain-containing protein n=1 Tax=Cryptotermes secundus TaxID=105785 RepID=A0A2J7PS16_9NEOP|nr:hypothetical protein B7P43_G09791 [Cryptotermes secundus]